MSQYCVVVAEGSRARFFTVEPAEIPELQSGPDLIEHKTMVNPEHKVHDTRLMADRTGSNRSGGGQRHEYDDHRGQRDDELERRFARQIARELDSMARGNGTRKVVVCAEKRMMGFLRPTLQGAIPNGVSLREVKKDLAKLSARQLHDHLAREGHLPRRAARTGH